MVCGSVTFGRAIGGGIALVKGKSNTVVNEMWVGRSVDFFYSHSVDIDEG